MKQRLTMRKNSLLLLLSFFVCFVTFTACNNEGKKKETPDTTTGTTTTTTNQLEPTPGPGTLATQLDNFPVLYTEFQNIETIFTAPGVGQRKKIVFHFSFDGGATNGQPTLSGYSVKQNGTFQSTNPELVLTKSTRFVNLPYPLYLGNIELTQNEFRVLRADATRQIYIVFTPRKSLIYPNVVTYITSWSPAPPTAESVLTPIKINAIGDELNPSPPKNPS